MDQQWEAKATCGVQVTLVHWPGSGSLLHSAIELDLPDKTVLLLTKLLDHVRLVGSAEQAAGGRELVDGRFAVDVSRILNGF